MTTRYRPSSIRWLYDTKFEKIDFPEMTTVEVNVSVRVQQTVAKSAIAPRKPDTAVSLIFTPLKMYICSSCDGIPLKFKKKNGWASSLRERII